MLIFKTNRGDIKHTYKDSVVWHSGTSQTQLNIIGLFMFSYEAKDIISYCGINNDATIHQIVWYGTA